MKVVDLKLGSKLYDLFQHCQIWCSPDCCKWDAFDLSERWIGRWCEFRDSEAATIALREIEALHEELDGQGDIEVNMLQFQCFRVPLPSLLKQLDEINAAIRNTDRPSSC